MDSSDGSGSDSDGDGSIDVDDNFLFDGVRRDGDDEAPDGSWTFAARSARGAAAFEGLGKRVISSKDFQLQYNPVDSYLQDKMTKEVKHALSKGRIWMHEFDEGQKISAMDAFAVAMPFSFLKLFKDWLNTADDKDTAASVSFDDVIEFLRCELVLPLFGISSSELLAFDMTQETVDSYRRVRSAMTNADRPASDRPIFHNSAGPDPDDIDPIMTEVIESMNKEWRDIYFVSGVSSMDIDDDKLPYCSKKWTDCGFKRTPTKDKKLKPVCHITCTTGSGYIVNICPDTILLRLGEMLRKTIIDLIPQKEMRPMHAFFIDRGYLELAKEQEIDVTNLIQIMRELAVAVRFLGTVKNSLKYPFYFVEVNEDGKTAVNKRGYGTHGWLRLDPQLNLMMWFKQLS